MRRVFILFMSIFLVLFYTPIMNTSAETSNEQIIDEVEDTNNTFLNDDVLDVSSWNVLKEKIENTKSDITIRLTGNIEKTDQNIIIPSGVNITLIGDNVKILRASKSSIGEFYVSENAKLTLEGNFTIEAKNYENDKGSLSYANFIEVNEQGYLFIKGNLTAHTSDGYFNGRYGQKGFIYCKGNMEMFSGSSISGWTVYDTTSLKESRNAAIVLEGKNAQFTMQGGEITGNYNVGSNGVAGASVQVHDGASFIMNDGSIHHNGIINTPESNVHNGAGVFVYGEESSFKMIGGTIQDNNGMRGAGVYISGTKNAKALFEMTGGKIENNEITNLGKSTCDGGGIYAKYADINIATLDGNENISISKNGTKDFGSTYRLPQSSGGGIYAEYSVVNLKNVNIEENTACGNNGQGGAGIYLKDSEATIIGGVIANNQSGKKNQNVWGGGLSVNGTGNVLVKEVLFTENLASPESDYEWNIGYGGAIFVDAKDTLTIEDCRIKNNHASGSGGGIYVNEGTVELTGNTVLESNRCNNDRTQWESYLGEAICITPNATVKIYDQVRIDKNNTVGLEEYRGDLAVLTIGNQYTGIDSDHPIAIESMNQQVEKLPDVKGTPLIVFTEEAGGAKAAENADKKHHFITSEYMPNELQIGQSEENGNILTYTENKPPVIYAENRILTIGDKFNAFDGVTATDKEDGDLTGEIEILNSTVDTSKVGVYEITYKVTDKQGASSTKTIYVTVNPKMEGLNHIPAINASDKTIAVGDKFDPLQDVTATDKEDGDLTGKIEILNSTVDTTKTGVYEIVYKVTDSQGAASVKAVKVIVENKIPVIPDIDDEDKPSDHTDHSNNAENTVNTGDFTNDMLWIFLLIISACLVGGLSVIQHKKKYNKKS